MAAVERCTRPQLRTPRSVRHARHGACHSSSFKQTIKPVTLVLILCAHSAVATAADDVRCKIRDRVQFRIPIRVTKQDDVRWNLEGYVAISNRKVVTEGHELLPDGSLVIMSALKNDSGNYTVDIFNQTGFWKRTEQFHLEIDDDLVRKGNCQPAAEGNRSAEQFVPRAKDGISNRSCNIICYVGISTPIILVLVFMVLLVVMVKRRAREVQKNVTGNNTYMEMHGNLLKKSPRKSSTVHQEESFYVVCSPPQKKDQDNRKDESGREMEDAG